MPRRRLSNMEKFKLIFSLVVRISILFAVAGAILNRRWMLMFVSILTFILTFLPALIERNYKIMLPSEFEMILVLFIYTSLFLGEIHGYYTLFWWWDVVLHTGSGLILGFIGFLILFVLYKEQKIVAKPITLSIFAFSFALSLGAVWEIFEFTMDQVFGLAMQKSSLVDTMWDLIVDALGALFTSFIGYLYMKGRRTPFFEGLLNRFMDENPGFYRK